jgi:hypothetical protein
LLSYYPIGRDVRLAVCAGFAASWKSLTTALCLRS